MHIYQWKDKNLSHYSYGILSEKKLVLIDPSRNPEPYLQYAKDHDAEITAIIETHPHADFVSSHLELHQLTGAPVYVHSTLGASYDHKTFDEGAVLEFGQVKLHSLHTPGHSPDSITILLEHEGKQKAVFSGDTLFIGDCGRPDLREGAGNLRHTRLDLAKSMYHSLRDKYMDLDDDAVLYPAHGAGTLCGKGLSDADSSTMGREKETNWCLQPMTEEEFTQKLLSDQPFVPAYFPASVELNRKGAPAFRESIEKVRITEDVSPSGDIWIIDARKESAYKKGHLSNSINLMEGGKFETWLGSIIYPGESFYLAGADKGQLMRLIERAAAIGYEAQIKSAFVIDEAEKESDMLDLKYFKEHKEEFTVVDVRNVAELKQGGIIDNSIPIPLPELRSRVNEIPTGKPIVVHCAAGYRSAAGSSIIKSSLNGGVKVYDLGEAIKEFQ